MVKLSSDSHKLSVIIYGSDMIYLVLGDCFTVREFYTVVSAPKSKH